MKEQIEGMDKKFDEIEEKEVNALGPTSQHQLNTHEQPNVIQAHYNYF